MGTPDAANGLLSSLRGIHSDPSADPRSHGRSWARPRPVGPICMENCGVVRQSELHTPGVVLRHEETPYARSSRGTDVQSTTVRGLWSLPRQIGLLQRHESCLCLKGEGNFPRGHDVLVWAPATAVCEVGMRDGPGSAGRRHSALRTGQCRFPQSPTKVVTFCGTALVPLGGGAMDSLCKMVNV